MELETAQQRQHSSVVPLNNFRSAKYRLVEPLWVAINQEGEHFVVSAHDTGQYGTGLSIDDAIAHLCSVLEGYYELLQEERENLSNHLQGHFRYLKRILREDN